MFFGVSCDIINPEEEIPSYIYIDDIKISIDDTGIQGAESEKFTDAWVFIEGNNIGAFELPAIIPVLEEGEHLVQVFAGITNNGIQSSRLLYPLTDPDSFTVNLVRGEIDTLSPVVRYSEETVFPFVENFEGEILYNLDLDGLSTRIERYSGDFVDGSNSGRVVLDTAGREIFWVASYRAFPELPIGRPVFLEMDYKNTIEFTVQLRYTIAGASDAINMLTLNPKEDWNKIYVDLTPEVQANEELDFQISFYADILDGQSSAEILFDNIKLIYR